MSKRFGRNQKRKLKAELKEANNGLSYAANELLRFQREYSDKKNPCPKGDVRVTMVNSIERTREIHLAMTVNFNARNICRYIRPTDRMEAVVDEVKHYMTEAMDEELYLQLRPIFESEMFKEARRGYRY
jgi:hypothetical protein